MRESFIKKIVLLALFLPSIGWIGHAQVGNSTVETMGIFATTDILTHENNDRFDIDYVTYFGTGVLENQGDGGARVRLEGTQTFTISGYYPNAECGSVSVRFFGTRSNSNVNVNITVNTTMDPPVSSQVAISGKSGEFLINFPSIDISGGPFTVTFQKTGGGMSAQNVTIDDVIITGSGVGCDLPIELTSFSGKHINNGIQLHWRSASEKNNDYMEVQRSKDGKAFDKLGTVRGAGNSAQVRDYTFTDEHPMPGVNYYRLKQVDFDGKEAYHKVIAVLFKNKDDKNQGITLFPTVVSEQLNFALNQEADTHGEIKISDMNGRIMLRQPFERDMQQQTILVQQFPRGQYILTVQTGRDMQVARFVKE